MNHSGTYSHTQRAPLCLTVYAVAAIMFFIAWFVRNEVPTPVLSIVLSCAGLITLIMAASIHYLIVEDEGDHLSIRFGPLPLFRRTIRYEKMTSVTIGRTSVLDGWGIHWTLGKGWVWNLWGYDCVMIHHHGHLTLGTDDPENLAVFLKSKIQETS